MILWSFSILSQGYKIFFILLRIYKNFYMFFSNLINLLIFIVLILFLYQKRAWKNTKFIRNCYFLIITINMYKCYINALKYIVTLYTIIVLRILLLKDYIHHTVNLINFQVSKHFVYQINIYADKSYYHHKKYIYLSNCCSFIILLRTCKIFHYEQIKFSQID